MSERAVPSSLEFRAIDDGPTGASLQEVFQDYWPAYRRWMRGTRRTPIDDSTARLNNHMPELMPVYQRLLDAFGGGPAVAAFLTLYNPPRVVRGCSQVVIDDNGPVLLRSYDHHPTLTDGLVLRSRWLDRTTIAMTDCLWGALDGVNEHGLAVALAFGGRDAVGPGFAAPLVTRYLLETCATVADAGAVLERVPVYMPYTFVVADAAGDFVTAYTGPDAPTRLVTRRASTNHQSQTDWPSYCKFTQSVERLATLESQIGQPGGAERVIESFLRPPLWRTDYAHASGTLYVAEYRPAPCSLALHWPGRTERFGLSDFEPRDFEVEIRPSDNKPEPAAT